MWRFICFVITTGKTNLGILCWPILGRGDQFEQPEMARTGRSP